MLSRKVVHCSLWKHWRWFYDYFSNTYLDLEVHTFDSFLFSGSSSRKLSRLSRKNLYKRLLANSYFVLSFENSHCQDYITEKFFYALDSPAVPVVMGPNRWISILIFWWFLMTLVSKSILLGPNMRDTLRKVPSFMLTTTEAQLIWQPGCVRYKF